MERILNVGCGSDTYGTDFIDLYPTRQDVVKCDIENNDLPYPDNYFDEVYCRGIFEHLKSPHDYLIKVFRIIKPGGRIVIITDNAFYWVWSLKNSLHLGGYEKHERSGDKHYALYTDHHMRNHLSVSGFVNIETKLQPQPEYSGILKKMLGKSVNLFFKITPSGAWHICT